MIEYDFHGRLSYLAGGPLDVQMSAWPVAAGANWWEPTTGSYTAVAAYRAIGAADLATSYVNLANPGTYDLTTSNAPSFDATDGWTFNGSTNFLDTGFIEGVTWTTIVRFSNVANNGALFGSGQAYSSHGRHIHPYYSATIYYRNSGNFNRAGATEGVVAIANKTAYLNGSSVGTIDNSLTSADYTCWIGSSHRNELPQYINAKIQAVAIYSTTLDATQVAEISANMAAL